MNKMFIASQGENQAATVKTTVKTHTQLTVEKNKNDVKVKSERYPDSILKKLKLSLGKGKSWKELEKKLKLSTCKV